MKTNLKLIFFALFQATALLSMEKPELGLTEEPIAWGLFERQGIRPEMEDAYAQGTLNLVPWASARYFAIFDGHDGKQAADYAADHLFERFDTAYQSNLEKSSDIQTNIRFAFKKAFEQTDAEIQSKYERAGTTALAALILGDELYLAWAGDSRAVVADSFGIIKTYTNDHNPQRFEEKARIIKAGEQVTMHPTPIRPVFRVSNGIAMSRSIGDRTFKQRIKPGAVIAEPEIKMVNIKKGDFIILGCDGLWDVIDNEPAVRFVAQDLKEDLSSLRNRYGTTGIREHEITARNGNNTKLETIAIGLTNYAYIRKSMDNISVMILEIKE